MAKAETILAPLARPPKFERRVVTDVETTIGGGVTQAAPILHNDDEVMLVVVGRVRGVTHKPKGSDGVEKMVRQQKIAVKEIYVLSDDGVVVEARSQHNAMHVDMFGEEPALPLESGQGQPDAEWED
jgi:hypothetical protein